MSFSTNEFAFSFISDKCEKGENCDIMCPGLQSFSRSATITPSSESKVPVSFMLLEYRPAIKVEGSSFIDNVGFIFKPFKRLTPLSGISMVAIEATTPSNYL